MYLIYVAIMKLQDLAILLDYMSYFLLKQLYSHEETTVYTITDYYKQPRMITHMGAQWLSGRVLDSRPKGRGFELHRRHCVVILEQDTFILA